VELSEEEEVEEPERRVFMHPRALASYSSEVVVKLVRPPSSQDLHMSREGHSRLTRRIASHREFIHRTQTLGIVTAAKMSMSNVKYVPNSYFN